ncbi:MAG: M20/M25/M40 family metallo-hydrolase [Clostridia bacterium]|nr:M20/M25/M40 family metallo-hydrolase [Clostridia bacterium]
MSYTELFSQIEALNEEYLSFLEDVCNIESPTNFKEGVDKTSQYFINKANEKGWKIEVLKQEISGDVVCITLNPEVKEKPISLSAHLDTVHPIGFFGYPPVKRDSEKMYGPGVLDCKGGAVTAFMAMDALQRIGFKKRPVMLLLQSDEEVSSSTSNCETIDYVCEKAKNSVGFLNLEGCIGNTAVLQRKGILRLKFEIKGKAEHSSRCYQGASAIAEAAHKILKLEKLKDKDGITCNCGIINGGTVANTVAEECNFVADIRFATNEQYLTVMELIDRISQNSLVDGCSCIITKISSRPAMPKNQMNDGFLEKINSIFKLCDLAPLSARFAMGGSDAAYSTQAGIPTVDSFGTEGGFIHSINEFIYLKSVVESAKKIAAVCYGI